jgi:hypothetical protein
MKVPSIEDMIMNHLESIKKEEKELEDLKETQPDHWKVGYLERGLIQSKSLLPKYKDKIRDIQLGKLGIN